MNIKVFRLTDSYCHPCEGPRLAGTQSKDPELYRHNGFPLQFTPHRVYPAQSLPRTVMRGCGEGMTNCTMLLSEQ